MTDIVYRLLWAAAGCYGLFLAVVALTLSLRK